MFGLGAKRDPLCPPCSFESFKQLFLKPYFSRTKVSQNIWISVILPNISWKMSKQREQRFFIMFGIRSRPPPSLEKVQIQTKKFLKILDFDEVPPHSLKISKHKQQQKVPTKVWNRTWSPPPPPTLDFFSPNRRRFSYRMWAATNRWNRKNI